jgi:hypothetical protein
MNPLTQSEIEQKARNYAATKYSDSGNRYAAERDFLAGASAREEEYRALVEAMLRFFKAKDNYKNHYSNRNANQLIWAEEAARQALKSFNEKV